VVGLFFQSSFPWAHTAEGSHGPGFAYDPFVSPFVSRVRLFQFFRAHEGLLYAECSQYRSSVFFQFFCQSIDFRYLPFLPFPAPAPGFPFIPWVPPFPKLHIVLVFCCRRFHLLSEPCSFGRLVPPMSVFQRSGLFFESSLGPFIC